MPHWGFGMLGCGDGRGGGLWKRVSGLQGKGISGIECRVRA